MSKKDLKVWQKIERYSAAYHSIELPAPPYRITLSEYHELANDFVNKFVSMSDWGEKTFFGIKLELVDILK